MVHLESVLLDSMKCEFMQYFEKLPGHFQPRQLKYTHAKDCTTSCTSSCTTGYTHRSYSHFLPFWPKSTHLSSFTNRGTQTPLIDPLLQYSNSDLDCHSTNDSNIVFVSIKPIFS